LHDTVVVTLGQHFPTLPRVAQAAHIHYRLKNNMDDPWRGLKAKRHPNMVRDEDA
jgi:hypothetical protein